MQTITVSIVLPILNERKVIEKTINSLTSQTPFFSLSAKSENKAFNIALEIFAVDGGSSDGTLEILESLSQSDPRLKVINNPQKRTPFALNLGINAARGSFVGIFSAHCIYEKSYISTCLRKLLETSAAGCSGKLISARFSQDTESMLCHQVMSHPFGVSGSSFRTQTEGFVDSIPCGIFRKEILLELGGYNESMLRNQDNDLNYRIRKAGHKLYLTEETWAEYQEKSSLFSLISYAWNNGSWCGVSSRIQPLSLGIRHYTPLIFFLSSALGPLFYLLFGSWHLTLILLLPIPLHLLFGHIVALSLLVKNKTLVSLLTPWIFLTFHLTYGFGFLVGSLSFKKLSSSLRR